MEKNTRHAVRDFKQAFKVKRICQSTSGRPLLYLTSCNNISDVAKQQQSRTAMAQWRALGGGGFAATIALQEYWPAASLFSSTYRSLNALALPEMETNTRHTR
eukprot:1160915-Pelagomonas_calceolata.AAC.20